MAMRCGILIVPGKSRSYFIVLPSDSIMISSLKSSGWRVITELREGNTDKVMLVKKESDP